MQKEVSLGKREIFSLCWNELTAPANDALLQAVITCYRVVFDSESGFVEDKHTPELILELMGAQLGGTRNSDERIWVVFDDWNEEQHTKNIPDTQESGYLKVTLDDEKKRAVVGLAWTTGKNTDETFVQDTVVQTATLFKPKAEAETIRQNVVKAINEIPSEEKHRIAYASEMAIRKAYRDNMITSGELLRISGEYLLTLGMEKFILWTDKWEGHKSPMFDIATRILGMQVLANLNENDRYLLLGDVAQALNGLENPRQRLKEAREKKSNV